ncbi:hypothetical protein [Clostridium beijerinckii]|uniref:hypothetical protein n=1 Tax=Clostridium beijerinckii TaxID=1520 RepID=UPI00047EAADF|nr:hypothetical protein [Clostridium beijerinckii]
MEIQEQFVQYKNITLIIMETVKTENYEKLDEFFSQRQSVLDNINKLACSKEELNRFYLKYDVYELDKTLEKEMNSRKEALLEKIKENQKRRIMMNGYNDLQARSVFLSKEL